MANSTRILKSLIRLFLPAILLVVTAFIASSVFLVYTASHPITGRYLVTPDKYGQLSTRAAQVTDETWSNKDGSSSRGWLLRGADNAPAVILLHKFGADRSYVLNLGVKLNESTNFTVLMPDLRAHGENPSVQNASFGGCESEDLGSALEFLRNLKTPNQIGLVNKNNIGVYGLEMGTIVAMASAASDQGIRAVALDSAPSDSDGVLKATVEKRFPFASIVTTKLAEAGTHMYFYDGCYRREPMCDTARKVENRDVLLLAGVDAQAFQESTSKLARCFPASNRIESKTDLSPSGLSISNASMEQSESYDQRLIDFFRMSLLN